MLSTTADHALRAILYLAQQSPGRAISADEVAGALGAPRNYLSKTLYALGKARILTATAGRGGGYMLAVPADQLTVEDVIRVFDSPNARSHCLLGNRMCNPGRPCAAHVRWNLITQSTSTALATTTIAALIGEDTRIQEAS